MKTFEIGIDLGTTNSAIAIVRNGEIEIIKNSNGEEATPSVVLADKNGKLVVGSKAKRKALEDSSVESAKNWRAEVKRLMGTNETVSLPNYGSPLTPEQISSEILKSLLADVSRRYADITLSSAVITVPAHFSTLQSEATKRAGDLSGISNVILLQEPIAAAVAYGFTTNTDDNWLVYDLGGGTFDVALVASRGGSLTVLAHGGDNFLGGKDIDAAIVDNFIINALKAKGHNHPYTTDQNLHKKLRVFAEQGKIDLSTSEATTVDIEIELDSSSISETLNFTRMDLLDSCKSILKRTIDICRETIKDSHVDSKSIGKIVLVGGPTQMPVLRSFLEGELKVKVDGTQDPLTVVAKGAALFAQQIPVASQAASSTSKSDNSAYHLDINFSPVTSEDQQTITGKIKPLSDKSKSAHTICFQAEDKSYSSGDVLLKNDKFIIQLPTPKKSTQFWIYIKDAEGNLLEGNPDSLSISKGVSISGAPLPHSIGVSILSLSASKGFIEDEIMDIFFQKNSILPVSTTKRYYTVSDLKASEIENALPVRVYEGESPTPNRNSLVCDLAITGKMVHANLKKGSPVDITITIDESRQLSVKAYIPEIDLTLNARATIYDEDISVNDLKQTLSEQSKRKSKIDTNDTQDVTNVDSMISDIKTTIEKSVSDSDQKRKASKQLKDLMMAIDNAEARAEFDRNVAEFLKLSEDVQAYISHSNPQEKRPEYSETFTAIKQEGIRAIDTKDAVILKQTVDKLGRAYTVWMFSDPVYLMAIMNEAQQNRNSFQNKEALDQLLEKCENSVKANDINSLRENVFAIMDLNNENKTSAIKTLKAGITR